MTASAGRALLCAFTVPGSPVPKARARVFFDRRTGKYQAATPKRVADAEARVASYLKVAYPHMRPLEGRLGVALRFHLKGVRGDVDNFQKLICDALNGKAWLDDKQIDEAVVSVTRNSLEPRTEIEVYAL